MGINSYDSTVKAGYVGSNAAVNAVNNVDNESEQILTPPLRY